MSVHATPANKTALERHYDNFLAKNLNACTTCHLPSAVKTPESLEEFPHNPFGHRLQMVGKELSQAGKNKVIPTRLAIVAKEDSDGDGIDNATELLLGHNPGDAKDTPIKKELAELKKRRVEFEKFLASYRWQPFEVVKQPPVPQISTLTPRLRRSAARTENQRTGASVESQFKIRSPIDSFIAAEHQARDLKPRPAAAKDILLRRVYLDLIGLSPTPEEQRAFAEDHATDAYEKVVDHLLDDPRYGERWGRHWMDVWRYSDWAGWTDGGQVRDSKPHIWRWRDWIVESLNQDKGYDRMVLEMLAADELAPEDTDALRATGFLVRNYKMLSREQWLEDTVKHTSQAFLGITMGCAKCHNHMYDPFSQKEYYQLRAIFEPHQVRTDRLPGQIDTAKDGLVRVYDVGTNAPTYFFPRGDERKPDTNLVMSPGVPLVLCGNKAAVSPANALPFEPVKLPRLVAFPDKREFVIKDTIAAGEKALADAREAMEKLKTNATAKPEKIKEQELNIVIAESKQAVLLATLQAEKLEDSKQKESDEWKGAATEAANAQRKFAGLEAKLKVHLAQVAQSDSQAKVEAAAKALEAEEKEAQEKTANEKEAADKVAAKKTAAAKANKALEEAMKKTTEAEKTLVDADKEIAAPPTTAYKPRPAEAYPESSTGRRLAFARWVARRDNPLTARVAMNHLWLRHFGLGIVPTPADFGRNGRPPSHPQLLDWLAAEFMAKNWSMKKMHRLIVTSSTYRQASTADETNAQIDPDNIYLWRMNSRRLEAEAVRDNVLYVSGSLDPAMGGPDIDHKLGLTSKRRSLYLCIAAEKEVEFLKIFDSPSVTECYERKPSVMPQQALAMSNSELTLAQAKLLATELATRTADENQFIAAAFQRILARRPSTQEMVLCSNFLAKEAQKSTPQTAPLQPVANQSSGSKASIPRAASRARENLVLVLFNHNDFVTVR